jgi:hypothetical protein
VADSVTYRQKTHIYTWLAIQFSETDLRRGQAPRSRTFVAARLRFVVEGVCLYRATCPASTPIRRFSDFLWRVSVTTEDPDAFSRAAGLDGWKSKP